MISAAEVGVSIITTSAGTLRPLLVWAGIFPVSEGFPTLDEIQLSSASVGNKSAESHNPAERAV